MRGGQGQLSHLGNVLSGSVAPSKSKSSQNHEEDTGDHRITTYRPTLLRRNDQFEVVQSIDYRIPKSLQYQAFPYPQTVQEYSDPQDINNRRISVQPLPRNNVVQFGNFQSGFPHGFRPQNHYQNEFLNTPPQQALEYPRAYQNNNYRPNEQQGSYARFEAQQGNQNLNSFVRY